MRIFESVFICGFILFLLIEGAFYAGRSLWTDDWEFSVKSGLYHGSPFEYLVDQGRVPQAGLVHDSNNIFFN